MDDMKSEYQTGAIHFHDLLRSIHSFGAGDFFAPRPKPSTQLARCYCLLRSPGDVQPSGEVIDSDGCRGGVVDVFVLDLSAFSSIFCILTPFHSHALVFERKIVQKFIHFILGLVI